MPRRKAPPVPSSQKAVAAARRKSLAAAHLARPSADSVAMADGKVLQYLVPLDADTCYRDEIAGDLLCIKAVVCGCGRCAPHLWCSDCLAISYYGASRVFATSAGFSDGRCLKHTRLLEGPPAPPSEAARAEIQPGATPSNKVNQ